MNIKQLKDSQIGSKFGFSRKFNKIYYTMYQEFKKKEKKNHIFYCNL